VDKATAFLGWVAGGTGVVLLYSAYRNQGPLSVITNALGKAGPKTSIVTGVSAIPGVGAIASGNNAIAPGRVAAIAARKEQPVYVSIGSQPALQLDKDAAASFATVEAAYGKKIWLTGAARSYAAQVVAFRENPHRFGNPNQSLHVVGLAVDVNGTLMNLEDPALIAAFSGNGWFRAAMKLANGLPEPWHWSYGVPG
jgi:hypothetical protein